MQILRNKSSLVVMSENVEEIISWMFPQQDSHVTAWHRYNWFRNNYPKKEAEAHWKFYLTWATI
jgi:hypothetical protein